MGTATDSLTASTSRLIRVFPRRTKATPDDALAYVGPPDMFAESVDRFEDELAAARQGQATRWSSVDDPPLARRVVLVHGGVAYRGADGDWWTITGFPWPGERIKWPVLWWMELPVPPVVSLPPETPHD